MTGMDEFFTLFHKVSAIGGIVLVALVVIIATAVGFALKK